MAADPCAGAAIRWATPICARSALRRVRRLRRSARITNPTRGQANAPRGRQSASRAGNGQDLDGRRGLPAELRSGPDRDGRLLQHQDQGRDLAADRRRRHRPLLQQHQCGLGNGSELHRSSGAIRGPVACRATRRRRSACRGSCRTRARSRLTASTSRWIIATRSARSSTRRRSSRSRSAATGLVVASSRRRRSRWTVSARATSVPTALRRIPNGRSALARTLSLGRVDLSVLWRYLSPIKYEGSASDFLARGFTGTNCVAPGAGAQVGTGVNCNRLPVQRSGCDSPSTSPLFSAPGTFNGQTVNFNRIPAFHYFDFSTRFSVNEHFDLTFTVQNLFDKDPPIVGNNAVRPPSTAATPIRRPTTRWVAGSRRVPGSSSKQSSQFKGERRAFGSASFLWDPAALANPPGGQILGAAGDGMPACSASSSPCPSGRALLNSSTSPVLPRTSMSVRTNAVAPPS